MQATSLKAWSNDLERTGKALGLGDAAWIRAIDAAIQRSLASSEVADRGEDRVERVQATHRFLLQRTKR